MDAAYIKSTVSEALVEALAVLARVNPENPVDYLGKLLVKHADTLDAQARVRAWAEGRPPACSCCTLRGAGGVHSA